MNATCRNVTLYRVFDDGTVRVDFCRDVFVVRDLTKNRSDVAYAAELEVIDGIPTASPLLGDDKKHYRGAVEASQEEFG